MRKNNKQTKQPKHTNTPPPEKKTTTTNKQTKNIKQNNKYSFPNIFQYIYCSTMLRMTLPSVAV